MTTESKPTVGAVSFKRKDTKIKPVFIFRLTEESDSKFAVVSTMSFDWVYYDAGWMCDSVLGERPLVPDVDLRDHVWMFDTEDEALEMQAILFATQLWAPEYHRLTDLLLEHFNGRITHAEISNKDADAIRKMLSRAFNVPEYVE